MRASWSGQLQLGFLLLLIAACMSTEEPRDGFSAAVSSSGGAQSHSPPSSLLDSSSQPSASAGSGNSGRADSSSTQTSGTAGSSSRTGASTMASGSSGVGLSTSGGGSSSGGLVDVAVTNDVLLGPGAVRGRIVDATTGMVISGVSVASGGVSTTTDQLGGFVIELPLGVYSVTYGGGAYGQRTQRVAVFTAPMVTTLVVYPRADPVVLTGAEQAVSSADGYVKLNVPSGAWAAGTELRVHGAREEQAMPLVAVGPQRHQEAVWNTVGLVNVEAPSQPAVPVTVTLLLADPPPSAGDVLLVVLDDRGHIIESSPAISLSGTEVEFTIGHFSEWALLRKTPMPMQQAVVSSARGNVTVNGSAALPGQHLYPGDAIVTSSDGEVELHYVDNMTMRLNGGSRFEIEPPVPQQEPSLFTSAVRLVYGKLRTLVQKREGTVRDRLRTRTPSAVFGVRGTAFEVEEYECGPGAGSHVGLQVVEGAVEITDSNGITAMVEHGNRADVCTGCGGRTRCECTPGDEPFVDLRAARDEAVEPLVVSICNWIFGETNCAMESYRQLSRYYARGFLPSNDALQAAEAAGCTAFACWGREWMRALAAEGPTAATEYVGIFQKYAAEGKACRPPDPGHATLHTWLTTDMLGLHPATTEVTRFVRPLMAPNGDLYVTWGRGNDTDVLVRVRAMGLGALRVLSQVPASWYDRLLLGMFDADGAYWPNCTERCTVTEDGFDCSAVYRFSAACCGDGVCESYEQPGGSGDCSADCGTCTYGGGGFCPGGSTCICPSGEQRFGVCNEDNRSRVVRVDGDGTMYCAFQMSDDSVMLDSYPSGDATGRGTAVNLPVASLNALKEVGALLGPDLSVWNGVGGLTQVKSDGTSVTIAIGNNAVDPWALDTHDLVAGSQLAATTDPGDPKFALLDGVPHIASFGRKRVYALAGADQFRAVAGSGLVFDGEAGDALSSQIDPKAVTAGPSHTLIVLENDRVLLMLP